MIFHMQICIDLLLLLDFRFLVAFACCLFQCVCVQIFVERMVVLMCVSVIRRVAYHMVCNKSAAAVAADGDGDACTVCLILFLSL